MSNSERLKSAFHETLRNHSTLGLHEKYECHFLLYTCATFSILNEEEGFVHFLRNLSQLPKINKRLGDDIYHYDIVIPLLDFLIVQVATMLMGNDEGTQFGPRWRPEKFFKFFKLFYYGAPSPKIPEIKKLPVFGIDKRIKQSIENGNVSELKLLIDLAPNPENRLKYIYHYLFNNQQHNLAEQLHFVAGKMKEDMFPVGYLFDYWRGVIMRNYDEYKIKNERYEPEKYPIYHMVAKGPFAFLVFQLMRKYIAFDENSFQEFQDNGLSYDFVISQDFPKMTFRNLMHFFAEFADDLLAIAETGVKMNKALLNYVRSAKNFVSWEQQAAHD